MIRLSPPTLRAYVSSTWGASRAYRGGTHEGIDLPDTRGAPVLAAAPGRVVRVDNVDNSYAGKWIAIQHAGGIVSRYLHNHRNDVSVGQDVRRGQAIGTVGGTGTKSGKPHVHFDIKATGAAVAEYVRKFGTPATGFGRSMSLGIGVPAEPLMSGATYRESAKADALARGVKFYAGVSLLTVAVVGFVGWGLWRLFK